MDRIQNILVPVDLSDFSSRLIKISKWLSDRIDAHFHFVYIVDERMVFHQVEQVGRGHLVDVRMQELSAIGGRRHSEGGLEQLDIPEKNLQQESGPVKGRFR